ncbi:hypothetical protein PDE_07200 [Penicillium oxalicum 114-2]|uniref:GPI anchored protein n=1 Tax=Penicillium oxalicum (strain 114-2 / CGMCC 5302) TaxID=933388 RepID=S7ZNI6_PENO1|nr:hypothetical protein PDE_07200 [Penicillium oxalicum 114-2]
MKVSNLSLALLTAVSSAQAKSTIIEYSTVPGYFLQDEAATDPSTFDFTAVNFGLIDRTYPADHEKKNHYNDKTLTQWERFYHQVEKLNRDSDNDVEYKVLFLGRHGEGYHNAAESYYGTPAWNALTAHDFWQKLIEEQKIHTPDDYYVSPLTRALQTANYTFAGLDFPRDSAQFKPVVKELFREGISIHTCDHRRSKSYIHKLFPKWHIEKHFTDEDELWNGVTSETSAAQDARSAQALGEVFFSSSSKKHFFVSVTSHSGEISSILRVVGHRSFRLSTGAVIPVLVKAEKKKVNDPPTTTTSIAWATEPHCTVPPVTSVSVCVCPSSAAPVTTPLVTGV